MTVPTDVVSTRSWVPASKKSYAKIAHVLDIPHLIQMQLDSFGWFQREGLRELLDEINPISDFTGTRMELRFGDYSFGEPKYSEMECRERDMTFSAPLRVNVQLVVRETGEVKEQELFMGDFPLMTPNGTFVINGAERVVVSQLVRSPGVYFTLEVDPTTGRELCYGKLIPNRGAWLEFETSNKDVLSVKVDRKRKIPVTTLLRAIDEEEGVPEAELGTNERILAKFADVDTNEEHRYIATTLEKEASTNKTEALLDFYRRLRPGDPPTLENARGLLNSLFFNARRYDLGRVGRYKLNRRLEIDTPQAIRVLEPRDLETIIKTQIKLNNGIGRPDDIDHLGNRRVRAVGELIQNQFRVGLLRMERVVRERMTIIDPDQATPSALINIRPVVASMKEFFGGSQLSQFMDQTNPLAELTHKRRLSALGPGGLSRDRAGFDVRDVHYSHYGRICPIETPEGPNIGLIGSLATYGIINNYGFIETPYRKVVRELPASSPELIGRYLAEDVEGIPAGTKVDEDVARRLQRTGDRMVHVRPFVGSTIVYLSADEEDKYRIAQANAILDGENHFIEERVEARYGERFSMEAPDALDYMDVSPKQILSVATSLIPFLEHNDAPRALMGSNMQRQAVPLVRPETPIVMTGVEGQAAQDSGQVILAEDDGEVLRADARSVRIRYASGEEKEYSLLKFVRSNQGTCINQRPTVSKGDRVRKGDALADSSSTEKGELALGQSVLCAFMSWQGYNFEDAIILSERLVRDDKFTSIHIEKHEVESRDTKLGPEEITRDIPNVGEESLRDLDENGIIRIGAEVNSGDILVGKITPKGETELTAEEKLLRAIFGEKAREVKDTSLRVPHGERGKVIDVKVFRRDTHDELPAGVNELVRVSIAQRRKVSEGDKMAGRHGNKGVVARILPVEDMPYLEDGTPVDIILNPIGVPSRMNVGQVLETHLGWAANKLGFRAVTPVFDGASDRLIEDELARAWLAEQAGAIKTGASGNGIAAGDGRTMAGIPYERLDLPTFEAWLTQQGMDAREVLDETRLGVAKRVCLEYWLEHVIGDKRVKGLSAEKLDEKVADAAAAGYAPPTWGKQVLIDGRSGEPFDQPVTVGNIYMLKLVHLVEDKIHARSTGPYSLITQQPLGGKAQFGGQRFGEMEVWALEAYGAAHILQELLTVKSDDIVGRVKAYEAIVKGEDVLEPGVPESFKVLVKELQSLGLSVEVLNEEEESVEFVEEGDEMPQLEGINISGFEKGEDRVSA
ncbi:MAG TPA: DNA-directed RNA polymerase subunit beta [Dehalococcoidia bacterium]|nr:DNA-directed RNA polymerase subunit beta [Dehalococcoidia bacterium]